MHKTDRAEIDSNKKESPLKSGAAAVDITPKKSLFIYGYPHVERMSEGAHDPLFASAIVISNASTKIALCSLDAVGVSKDITRKIRERVCARSDIVEKDILITCTHTHSGPQTVQYLLWSDDEIIPPVDMEYVECLVDSAASAILSAEKNKVPCEMGFATANALGIGGNRRCSGGIVDPEVPIVVLRSKKAGQIISVITAYCMHPTVLHEDSRLYSADFPGYARAVLLQALGPETVYLYQTGPEGNQSPRRFINSNSFEEADRLGTELGVKILEAIDQIATYDSEISLASACSEIMVPTKRIPALAEAQDNLAAVRERYASLKRQSAEWSELRTAECDLFGAEAVVSMSRFAQLGRMDAVFQSILPLELQLLELNGRFFAYIPGELFVEYSLMLKEQPPFPIYSVCLANGELEGYIVTEEAENEGGYEAWTGLFPPQAGKVIIAELINLQKKLIEQN